MTKTIRECLEPFFKCKVCDGAGCDENRYECTTCHGTGLKEHKLDQALASIRELVEGKKYGYLHGKVNCDCDNCKKVNTRNQAINEVLEMLK